MPYLIHVLLSALARALLGSVRTATIPPACPVWCRSPHPDPARRVHSRSLGTARDDRLTVELVLLQAETGGRLAAPYVRAFLTDEGGTVYADMSIRLASILGRAADELPPDQVRILGRALIASVFMAGGAR